jgi:outer membrane protein TolC
LKGRGQVRPFVFEQPIRQRNYMSHNRIASGRLLSALTLALMAAGSIAGAQVLQPGLQPGLTRAPDSARKISLEQAVQMAQQNSPQAVQAQGTERTSRAARVSAIGAILPSASLSAGRVIQIGGGQTRVNQNG